MTGPVFLTCEIYGAVRQRLLSAKTAFGRLQLETDGDDLATLDIALLYLSGAI